VLTRLTREDIKVLHTAGDKGEVLWILKSPVSRNQELDKDAFLLLAVCVVGRACVVYGGEQMKGSELCSSARWWMNTPLNFPLHDT